MLKDQVSMKNKLVMPFLILIFVSVSCIFPAANTTKDSSNLAAPAPLTHAPAADGPLHAEVSSPTDVLLSWKGLSADKFRLEISVGGSEFGTLAELPGNASSYENFPAIANRTIQYRLTAIKGSSADKPLLIEVQTPVQKPNPLTVTLKQDMTVPDPKSIDLSKINPETADPSALSNLFAPTQISSSAVIGPEGGQLSVTSSTGVKYTYTIPAGALDDTIPFTLKPYIGMQGAPLTGGFMGGVDIEPNGLELNEPAILTIEPAKGVSLSIGELLATFSFLPDGSEFYFTHTYTQADHATSYLSGKLAGHPDAEADSTISYVSVKLVPPVPTADTWVMQPWGEPQTTTSAVGFGGTTRASVKKQAIDHSPSDSDHQSSQNDAAADDALAPLVNPQYLDINRLSMNLSGWDNPLTLLSNMEDKYNHAKDKQSALAFMEKAIERLVDQLNVNFKLNLENCVSKDDFSAYYAAKSMKSPRTAFIKIVSARYQKKYGTSTVDDVLKKASHCDLKLVIGSTVTIKGSETNIYVGIESTIPLKIHYDAKTGFTYYSGSGPIKHNNTGGVAGGKCTDVSILTQGKGTFVVNKLFPVFTPSSAALHDFNLKDFTTPGSGNFYKAKCPGINIGVPVPDGSDMWGALYTATKFDEDMTLRGWQVTNPPVNNGELAIVGTAKTRDLQGLGSIGEESTFKLVLQQK